MNPDCLMEMYDKENLSVKTSTEMKFIEYLLLAIRIRDEKIEQLCKETQ